MINFNVKFLWLNVQTKTSEIIIFFSTNVKRFSKSQYDKINVSARKKSSRCTVIIPISLSLWCHIHNAGSIINDVLLFSSTTFLLLNYMSEASVSPYTHLINFQIWLSECASGGGFKYRTHFRNSPCKNAVFMSIDLRFQLLVIMVDSNVLKVSFVAVGDSFSKVFRLSSSKSHATKRAFSFDPLSVCFTEQTHWTEIHFWFWFSTAL